MTSIKEQHFLRNVRGCIHTEDIKKFNKLFEKIVESEGSVVARKSCNLCARTVENMRTNKVLTSKMAKRILDCYNEKFPRIKK